MNNKEKQELKELIREVVREELSKLNYGVIPNEKPSRTIDIQSVSVYACPVMETDKNIVYTTNTEDLL